MRFDSTPIDYYWQIVEPELLRTRMLESLFYLHSQPPLFNVVLGLGLKLGGGHFATWMHALYLVLGLAQLVAVYVILRRIEIPPWPSAAVATALAVTPAAIVYENWLFYEYPTATLLVLSALALTTFLRQRRAVHGVVFFSLLAAVILTRSIFQIPWFLAVVGLLLLTRPDLRRTVLVTAAAPLLAIVLLVAKNAVVFDVYGTSSWWGMNLAQVVERGISDDERSRLAAGGELSAASSVPVFSPPAEYVGIVPRPRPRGVPVLDRLRKENGRPNMNSEILIQVSRDYAGDSAHLIRQRPGAYAAAISDGVRLYLRPSTDYEGLNRNREKIGAYDRLFNAVLLQRRERFSRITWGLLVVHLIALGYGAVLTVRVVSGRIARTTATTTLAYIWVTLAYATTVVALAQVTENNRLRFFLDPLAVVLLAAAVHDVARRRRGRDAPASVQ